MAPRAMRYAVVQLWAHGFVRSSLALRRGLAECDVSKQRSNSWVTQRGISAQFVYDWQDIGTTAASGFLSWPNTVDFLLYPAGTWVKGAADVITLDTIYD